MKRVFLLILAVLVAASLYAQVEQVHYIDGATLQWDAVSTDANGDPLLPEDVVSYDVYVYDYYNPPLDDQVVADLILVGSTSTTSLAIDFSGYSRTAWAAGVRAVVTDGQGVVTEGPIAWSYDAVATNPTAPFLYIPLSGVLVLPPPTGLREAATP